jgi:hypothetical protein
MQYMELLSFFLSSSDFPSPSPPIIPPPPQVLRYIVDLGFQYNSPPFLFVLAAVRQFHISVTYKTTLTSSVCLFWWSSSFHCCVKSISVIVKAINVVTQGASKMTNESLNFAN